MAVEFHSNLGAVLKGSEEAIARAAEIIGGMAESYAKDLAPYKTGALRNHITHATENNNRTILVGSTIEYGPYVELGTGIYAEGGSRAKEIPWRYQDEKGNWHTTYGRRPKPFIRPAIENHKDEYREVLQTEMNF